MTQFSLRTLLPRFLSVGGLGFLLDAGVFQIVFSVGYGLLVSRVISATLSISFTWYLNRRYVFRTRSINARAPEYARYIAVQTVGLIVNFGVYLILISSFDVLHDVPVLALSCGALAALTFNFLGARHYAYRERQSAQ